MRWSDMDALGHVNNSRFFTYLEEARLAWFESLPEPWYDDRGNTVYASAEVVLVWIDRSTGKARPLPESIRRVAEGAQ